VDPPSTLREEVVEIEIVDDFDADPSSAPVILHNVDGTGAFYFHTGPHTTPFAL
jgi:hypothetical protein